MIKNSSYPFLWGVATSSHQIEGHNENNDWSDWEAQGHIEGGVKSGSSTDHWNRFREDIRLAADLGINSYRFSIEWSRLQPDEERFDAAAFERYADLIAECERYKITPMLTLHHFTSPRWFAQQGGFSNERSPEIFAAYVRQVVKRLGARISLWCTFNEPMVLVVGTYLGKFMPPALFSPALASKACQYLLKAHIRAYDILHTEMPPRVGLWRNYPLEVGIAHNMMDFLPDRAWHPMERLLTSVFWRFYNQSWLDAIVGNRQHFGVFGLLPRAEVVPEAMGRRTSDFIGVNYYTKAYVQWKPRDASQDHSSELPIGLAFARRKEQVSDLGWAIHPEGLGKILCFASRYRLPIYITENGIADREDRLRSSYIVSHLKKLAQAVHDGIDVRGYYHWSLLDNFEWIKGFWPRFGLYHVNYDTYERHLTLSGDLYKNIIAEFNLLGGEQMNLSLFERIEKATVLKTVV